jgi:LacI family transcriptional regulator
MATIYDVAARAGVSPATVSRVLNGKATVEPLLKTKVLKAVEALHFVPNSTARSLVTKRTDRIALLIPDITNPYYPEITRGAQDALDERGYHLLLSNTDDDPEREVRYLTMLKKIGVDGLIISPALPAEQPARRKRDRLQLSELLENLGIPVVSISPEPPAPNVDIVTIDEAGAAERAVQHLLELGHTKIALINGPENHLVSTLRQLGYKRALERSGIRNLEAHIVNADFRRAGGYEAMTKLLGRKAPTAVFAANDLMALGAVAAIHDAGLHIPKDIAVMGLDNIAEALDANPPLSTVSIPKLYDYGRIAANLLLDRLHTGDLGREARIVRLETRLIVRESTGHEPARGKSVTRKSVKRVSSARKS